MMTSAGSQRRLADFIGVSHQRVGRWLRIGETGGAKHDPRDAEILSAIDQAFNIHTDISREQALEDGLHFDANAPVYAARLWKQKKERIVTTDGEVMYRPMYDAKGEPLMHAGDRVSIEHTHWIKDELRRDVLTAAQRSGKYLHASVGSIVKLRVYQNRADARHQNKPRTELQRLYRQQFRQKLRAQELNTWAFTPYVKTPKNSSSDLITDRIDELLRERHEPATGERGTAFAAQYLFQVNNPNAPKTPKSGRKKPTGGSRKASTRKGK